jgi:putative oxidoreductase
MFPPGLPGIALVLLRVSVALTVLLQGYAQREALPAWVTAVSLLLSILLLAGFLTPILAVLTMVVQSVAVFHAPLPMRAFVAVLVLNALALALLGPGAYSLDALRFGRRVVRLSTGEDE